MASLTVRPFTPDDVGAAARLLARRHARDRARHGFLTETLEAPSNCEPLLRAAASSRRADGVAALIDGKCAGFLFGERMLLSPEDFFSLFIPPHSISIGIEGHAVAEDRDASAIYRAMYAHLAEGWVRAGFFVHRVVIAAGDPEVQEAWVALGFGRYLTAATRDMAPVEGQVSASIDVRRASDEDIGDVMALARALNDHHAGPPMFWPHLPAPGEAGRAYNLAVLRSGATPYFVGYQDGAPAGMQTFLRPGFTPVTLDLQRDVYLFEGVVAPGVRGGGIGTALLRHSIDWARAEGFATCSLHFASGNPSGAPFWLGHGFVPVAHEMERRIDERIAWAGPRG